MAKCKAHCRGSTDVILCPFIGRDQALEGAKKCLFQYQNLEVQTICLEARIKDQDRT